jgi:DNA repair protein RadC
MKHPSTLPAQWRPREKLLRYGAQALSLQELWACILGMGRPGKPVQRLARWIAENTKEKGAVSPDKISHELGKSQGARVLAALELSKRSVQREQFRIQGIQDVLLVVQELASARQEQILCLYLSATNELLQTECVAIGGLNAALLHPRDLFFPIRFQPVANMVLCHNHPSGNSQPSDEDRIFTARVQAACELLGITLYDHVIVAKDQSFSFREQGLLHATKHV